MTPLEKRNEILANRVVKNMQSRFMEAYFCKTKEEALKKALELIPTGESVSWGGCESMKEIGLVDALYSRNENTILDRANAKPGDDIMRMALTCDNFIMSSNAISEDGQLVNIDGNGNRCAALIFGPKSVVVIAGMNKVVPTVDDALSRAKNLAAPINAVRLNKVTGCTQTGSCTDCKTPDCICCNTVITRLSRPANKVKVILCGESLGF